MGLREARRGLMRLPAPTRSPNPLLATLILCLEEWDLEMAIPAQRLTWDTKAYSRFRALVPSTVSVCTK